MKMFRLWLWSMNAPRSAAMSIMFFCFISHAVLYSSLISSCAQTDPAIQFDIGKQRETADWHAIEKTQHGKGMSGARGAYGDAGDALHAAVVRDQLVLHLRPQPELVQVRLQPMKDINVDSLQFIR